MLASFLNGLTRCSEMKRGRTCPGLPYAGLYSGKWRFVAERQRTEIPAFACIIYRSVRRAHYRSVELTSVGETVLNLHRQIRWWEGYTVCRPAEARQVGVVEGGHSRWERECGGGRGWGRAGSHWRGDSPTDINYGEVDTCNVPIWYERIQCVEIYPNSRLHCK